MQARVAAVFAPAEVNRDRTGRAAPAHATTDAVLGFQLVEIVAGVTGIKE